MLDSHNSIEFKQKTATLLHSIDFNDSKHISDFMVVNDFLLSANQMIHKFEYKSDQQYLDDCIVLLSIISNKHFIRKDFYNTHIRILLNVCKDIFIYSTQAISIDMQDIVNQDYVYVGDFDINDIRKLNNNHPPIFPSSQYINIV